MINYIFPAAVLASPALTFNSTTPASPLESVPYGTDASQWVTEIAVWFELGY